MKEYPNYEKFCSDLSKKSLFNLFLFFGPCPCQSKTQKKKDKAPASKPSDASTEAKGSSMRTNLAKALGQPAERRSAKRLKSDGLHSKGPKGQGENMRSQAETTQGNHHF